MSRRGASLAAAAVLVMASAGLLTAESKTYRSSEWGFEFAYPDRLVAGRYKDTMTPERQARQRETGLESPFAHAIALVEPSRLGARAPLDALPVGEVAAVTVIPARGQKADFDRRHLFRKEWETTIAGRTVYRLPGYPAPYGDTMFYYLLPLGDDLVIELFAHRRHMDQARGETGYDRVIEAMIATFKTIAPGG
jgi:hypothetical protein